MLVTTKGCGATLGPFVLRKQTCSKIRALRPSKKGVGGPAGPGTPSAPAEGPSLEMWTSQELRRAGPESGSQPHGDLSDGAPD
eukprot:986473-Amphidinium_carterae.1